MKLARSFVLACFGAFGLAACGGSTDISFIPAQGEGGAGGAGGASSTTSTTIATTTSASTSTVSTATSSSTGTSGFCGDGQFDGGEQCDDGNDQNGDGCSAICVMEPGYVCSGQPSFCQAICGDGLLRGAENCDDGNIFSGDGCTDVCGVEAGWMCVGEPSACTTVCGDGVIVVNEACDDGNGAPGDGCSDTCAIEAGYSCSGVPSVCVASCGDGLVGVGEGCDDGGNSPGDGCDAACAVEPNYACTGSPSVCGPACGDGVVFLSETCDDANTNAGDGCSSTCQEELGFDCTGTPSVCAPHCGDAITIYPEACDDGNQVDNDGCSALCAFEGAVNEVESNDTTALADASTLQIAGSRVISGSIGVTGDIDFFRVTVASDSVIRFETAETLTPFDCGSLTTTVRVYDSAGAQLYSNNTSGIQSCSAVVAGLAAGVYYVSVEENGNDNTISQYYLDVAFHGNLGSELETNDASTQANTFIGSNVVIAGDHLSNADSDFYQIDIPVSGMSIRAETIEAIGGETCESNGLDSRLSTYDANAQFPLSDDDNAGRGACSRVDGTGANPSNNASHNLPAGTYYLRVRASFGAQNNADGQFNYRLALTLR